MEKAKAVGMLVLILISIALLLMPPTHATTKALIDPTSGPVGGTVNLIGRIDTEGGKWQIEFEADTGVWKTVKEGICDAGSFWVDTTFVVPNATSGDHTVKLKDLTSTAEATATFSVDTTWAVAPTPARQQEGLSVDLTITVSGALAVTKYNLSIAVTDPTGASYANVTDITAETDDTGFGSFTKTYPDAGVNFEVSANTNFTGTYDVVVNQTSPEFIEGVAATSFTIILTDKTSYQRTLTVNSKGSGFVVDEEVLINITDPTDTIIHADVLTATDGTVEDLWEIPLDAELGTYAANLTGVVTGVKTPPDLQEFQITEAILAVEITDQPPATIQRMEDAIMNFQIKYPDGSFYNATHLGTVEVSVYCNTTLVTNIPLSSANYEGDPAKWNVTWTIPGDAAIGSGYSFNLTADAITDPYENSGPAEDVSSETFTVGKKGVLTVEITAQPEEWYNRTATAMIKFNVRYPDGRFYTDDDLGTIRVRVYYGATWYASISLTADDFDSATNKWTTEWLVPWNAPLRSDYKFVVYADEVVDEYGNSGPAENVPSDMFEAVKVVLDVQAIHTDKASYESGETVTVYFTASYLDDSFVTTGTATITLTKADASTTQLTATYVTANGRFETKYTITASDPIGSWTAQLAAYGLKEGAGNTGPITDRERDFEVTFVVPPGVLTVEIHPETLNLKSNGRWITCYIKPPVGYDVTSIDLSTVELWYNGDRIAASWGNIEGKVLMVKFDRSQVIRLLHQTGVNGGEHGQQIELTIKAEVSGTLYEGTDTLRAMSPGKGKGVNGNGDGHGRGRGHKG